MAYAPPVHGTLIRLGIHETMNCGRGHAIVLSFEKGMLDVSAGMLGWEQANLIADKG